MNRSMEKEASMWRKHLPKHAGKSRKQAGSLTREKLRSGKEWKKLSPTSLAITFSRIWTIKEIAQHLAYKEQVSLYIRLSLECAATKKKHREKYIFDKLGKL